jgi:hypothetical protein
MIRITAWPGDGNGDHATATWNGQQFEALHGSPTTELARLLTAAGCPDQPWRAYLPDGTPTLRGNSIHAWAKRVVMGDEIRDFAKEMARRERRRGVDGA